MKLLLAFLFPVLSLQAQADSVPEDGWVQVGQSDSITILRKVIPGDPVFAYRGVGTLNAPLGKLITVGLDVKRQPEWVNRLEESRVVREITPFNQVLYLKVDTPWPLSDRDFVVEAKLTIDPGKKSAVVEFHSVQEAKMPPQDCCVRGVMHRNRVVLTAVGDGTQTDVNAEAHVDPKGSLPAWLVNLVQKSFPGKSIRGLLKQVSKPDIVDHFLTMPSGLVTPDR